MTKTNPATDNFIQLYQKEGIEISAETRYFELKCCKCNVIHFVEIEHTEYNTVILRFSRKEAP